MSSLWSVITLEKKNHVNVPAFGSSHYILTLCCIFFLTCLCQSTKRYEKPQQHISGAGYTFKVEK